MIDYLDKISQMKLEKPMSVDEIYTLEKELHFTFPEQYKRLKTLPLSVFFTGFEWKKADQEIFCIYLISG